MEMRIADFGIKEQTIPNGKCGIREFRIAKVTLQ
jgi:hypothetical protein